jgi:RND family efflux transporter MFP subunit
VNRCFATLSFGCALLAAPRLPAADPAPTVFVGRPVARDTADLDFAARLEPAEKVEVRADVTGVVGQVHCKDGADVKKGDVLVELDAEPLKKALENVRADLKKKEAAVEQAKKALEKLTKDKAPEVDIDKAKAERDLAEVVAQLARGDAERAERDLEQTRVLAPIGGRVTGKIAAKGDRVGPRTAASVCTIVRTDAVAAAFDVDPHTFLHLQRVVREGKDKVDKLTQFPVALALPDDKDFPHKGSLESVDNRADAKTGNIRFRAVFPDPDGKLTAALLAPEKARPSPRLRLTAGPTRTVRLVPAFVVGTDPAGARFVLIVNGDDVIEQRAVKTGARSEGLQIVEEGLKGDERVVYYTERAKRDPNDTGISPADFAKDVRELNIKPGTSVTPVRIKASPTEK